VFFVAVLLQSPAPEESPNSPLAALGTNLRQEPQGDPPLEQLTTPPQRPEAFVQGQPFAQGQIPRAASGALATTPAVSMSQIAEDVQIASPHVAGHIAEAEREMTSQGGDPLRSAAMETQILSEIAQKSLGLQMVDLRAECRITLCRVQFVLPRSFLDRKFGNIPRDAVWTGREPVSFFIKALDLDWKYTTAFGGLDRYGSPVVLGYVAMPLITPEP
jgi:hypothetical protein